MIKWGILSTGRISHDFTTALQYVEDAQVVAVGARSKESAEEFGKKFNIPRRYGTYEELAKDPEVQVIYIGNLHPAHKDSSILCLNHGKAVLCEKPIAMNAAEAKEIIRVAKEKNLLFIEGMWARHFPSMIKLRELIKSGALGDIQLVTADFGFFNDSKPRLHEKEMGGGATLDIGVYPLSFANMVFGSSPTKVKAIGHLTPSGIDDNVAVSLQYGESAIASLTWSFRADTNREATVMGTKGRARLHFPFWSSTKLVVTYDDKEETFEFPLRETREEHFFNHVNSMGFEYQARHVQQLIREGKADSDVISQEQSLEIMALMDEIRSQIGLEYPQDQ